MYPIEFQILNSFYVTAFFQYPLCKKRGFLIFSVGTEKNQWHEMADAVVRRWWWWIVFGVWLTDERRLAYFQPGPLSEILTIANLRHAASRIWICADPEFRVCWMKLCSSWTKLCSSDKPPHHGANVVKKFANFTGKHLCWSLFKKETLLKRDSNKGVFLWNLRNF